LSFRKEDDAVGVDMLDTGSVHVQHTDNNVDAKHTKLQGINGYTRQKQHVQYVLKGAIDIGHARM
jgi:hypothetical protein